MKLNQSFSARLSLYVMIATSVLCIGGLIGAEIFSVKELNKSVSKDAAEVLEGQIKDVEKVLAEVESATKNMVWVVRENLDDAEFMFHLSGKILENNPYIIGAAVAFEPYCFPSKGKWFAPYSSVNTDGKLVTYQCGTRIVPVSDNLLCPFSG